jgi:hypothetical protein
VAAVVGLSVIIISNIDFHQHHHHLMGKFSQEHSLVRGHFELHVMIVGEKKSPEAFH